MAPRSWTILWLSCSIFVMCLHHPGPTDATVRCIPGVQFACSDGTQCIPSPWRCDRDPDCRDVSDEENCTYTGIQCPVGSFQCTSNGVCLPDYFHCDSQPDCEDGSDEGPDCPAPPPLQCPPGRPYKCLDGQTCITYHEVCDDKYDCPDRSDEGAFCNPDNSKCKELMCPPPQHCMDAVDAMCVCPDGYKMSQEDPAICEDINECDMYGTCDQLCTNTEGSYNCSCAPSYTEESPGRCKASGEAAQLLVANVDSLLKLNLDGIGLNGSTPLPAMGTRAMDYDLKRNKICWVNFGNHAEQLQCADLRKMENIEVRDLILDLTNVQQIAIDWVTGNIYLMDDVVDAIIVCRSAGDICITLIDTNLHRPKGLALDPNEGFMFYTDWGSSSEDEKSKVERANMDGSGRINLNITKIIFPHGITVDAPAQRIYFADTQLELVQSARYDGSGQRIIAQGAKVNYLYGLTLFENYIYATKWQTNAAIIRINKFNGSVSELSTVTNRAGAIHIVHAAKQTMPVNHPCRTDNGKCEHLCVVSGKNTAQCRCQQGYAIQNETCSRNAEMSRFLLFGQGYPGSVRGIPIQKYEDPNYESMVPILNLQSPRAVDFYAAEDYVYYADSTNYTIGRQKLNGTHREDLLSDYITNCEGIAIDWISKNLYWTDDGSKTISVARLDGSMRRLLLQESFTHPRAIVVDPVDGYMYWTDWSEGVGTSQRARIERSYMDGTNRTEFVGDGLQWPNGLSLDKDREVLYWCDAFHDTIYRKFLNGTGTVEPIVYKHLNHPFGVTHYKDIIFWSEYRTGFIYRFDTTKPSSTPVELRKGGLVFELKLYDPNAQTGVSECSVKNGGCEQLCLPVPGGRVCQCENGKKLSNTTHCIEDPEYIRFSKCNKSANEFECNNGRCIDQTWLCDGDNDCGDNTDETHGGCYNQTCGPDKFQCPNNKCIPMRWTCDGDNDCGDHRSSDEDPSHCTEGDKSCEPDLFQCDNGRCISPSWTCDREDDCGDGSDEGANCSFVSCRQGLFQCNNGACISETWLCDRDDDCGDGSDEANCAYSCDNQTQFQCRVSLRCIDRGLVCDGIDHCEDGSDEFPAQNCSTAIPVVCTHNEFQCPEQRCIPQVWHCDGEDDCLNGTDEIGCHVAPVCRNQTHYQCPDESKCIPNVWKCDGIPDCRDQSDEVDCKYRSCELNQWQCQNPKLCIPLEDVCDGQNHCNDGSDERNCSSKTKCDQTLCKEQCNPAPDQQVMCSCPDGKVIDPEDHSKCIKDLKMCTKQGRCSQQCVNGKGTYVCKCYPGYVMSADGWTCKSNASAHPYLIFSNRNQLRRLNLNTSEYNVLVFNLHNSIAVDFHYNQSTIYWTDVVDDKIYRGWLDENSPNAGLRNIEPVVQAGLATCEGLAVDWIAGNLYWVESHLDQIEVSRLDGAMRTTVVAGSMESPRAIALDPTEGLMFWTDWENKNPRIERATMSGADRRVIVNITQLHGGWPNGLTIDYPEHRIYWIDARSDAIHAARYDGSQIFTVLKGHNTLYHPFAITVFEARVFWTDWRTNSVYQANKYTGENVTQIQKTSTQPFDIHVYHPYRQPRKPNPCGVNNGNCSHLCLLNGSKTMCACPHLMKLDTDGVTCINDTVFFVISRPTDIRGVDIDDGYYNVIPALTIPNVANASSISHDTLENRIYWTDLHRKSINRAYINGTAIETVIEGIPNAYNLAIDWVSRNMYWTNVSPEKSTINIARLDGSFQNEIDNLNLTNPRSIVIVPRLGVMYWINAGPVPTIEKAHMDGRNQTTIIMGDELKDPAGLAIDRFVEDVEQERLYWTDSSLRRIKSSNLDGHDIQTFLNLTDEPTAITVTDNKVFWAESNGVGTIREVGTIKYVRKDNPSDINILRGNTPGVMEMFMYNPNSQGGENACKDQNGGCQQLCLPLPSGRKCACTAGYIPTHDASQCEGVKEFLLYSTDDTIRGLSMEESSVSKDMLTPITGLTLAVAIDFDAETNFVYWADTSLFTLNRMKRDHTERQVLLTATNSRIEGIAVDWIAGNIYWTDQRNDMIEVSRTNGSFHYVLSSLGHDKPRAIVVHPVKGYLFWADWGEEPKIERSLLNGANRTTIVRENITWPNGLTIDYDMDMLYWCDARRDNIARVDFFGGNYKEIFNKDSRGISDPFALTLNGSYVYYTDRTSTVGSINRINKSGDSSAFPMRGDHGLSVKDIHVYSRARQPANPCGKNNGNCSQLCFYLGGTERVCACAHGTVAADGLNCQEHDAYILYSERNVIKSINLYNTSDKNLPIQPLEDSTSIKNVIGLAVDYEEKRIFFTDIQRGDIQAINVTGDGLRTIAAGIGSAEGIAYDPTFRRVYWTSYTNSSISRLMIDNPSSTEVLVRLTAADHPRGIVLDYCPETDGGVMFWTNWNEARPRIQRATLGGQNLTDIITTEIQMPNGIALDHTAHLLFWSDAKQDKIERCDFDGKDRVVLLMTEPVHPFGLAVFGDYIYWTDWVRRAVLRADKYDASDVTVLRANIPQQPMGIVIMAEQANDCYAYPCHRDNGGCDGMCTTNITGHVHCNCSEGQKLVDGTRCVVGESNCNVGNFICRDGQCIEYRQSCDGRNDCDDGSDENQAYCRNRFCRENYIKCNNGRCVAANRRCNGHNDCGDGSDEENCGCAENQFKCDSGECIPMSSVCDHRLDCHDDGSDEKKDRCPHVDCREWGKDTFFMMSNRTSFINCANTSVCIYPSWICDGANDCGDGSDELGCTPGGPVNATCLANQFRCDNGRCIPRLWRCDREDDCGDNSDEDDDCNQECKEGQTKCTNGHCIPTSWVCDRDNDCGDNSDENDTIHACSNKTCPGDMFRCKKQRRCISRSWVCDGDNDCGDAEDEDPIKLGCNVTRCKDMEFACANGRCIQRSWVCDHDDDCGDGSDEPDTCDFPTCDEEQHRCKDGRCIPKQWVCDGDKDCHDSSDEANCDSSPSTLNNCTKTNSFQCANGQCVPQSAKCNKTHECTDMSDELFCQCDVDLPCSQRCEDFTNGFWCYCVDGFTLLQDQVTCALEPDQPDPHLLFSNRYQLRTVDINGSNYTTLNITVTNAVALDYDWQDQTIYWSDVTLQNSRISRSRIPSGQPEVLHELGVLNPDGIAVDWAGRNLYWCDKGLNVIEVSRLDGEYRKTLIKENLDEPRAIVLDPRKGLMFWTDWGVAPYIGRASMDGLEFTRLVTEKIQWPNALTIDYTTDRIYWGDAREERIEVVDWDGQNRRTVVDSGVPHIFAMSLFGDHIYWTDWNQRRVKRAHKYTGANVQDLVLVVHRPMDIQVLHPLRQPEIRNNPCKVNNGGCRNLCLLDQHGGRTCACPNHFYLAADGMTCVSNCTSSQFVCDNHKCIPSWWRCDKENDCGDFSDEPEGCRPFFCTPGQFQCHNTTRLSNSECINPAFICDGENDCRDGSDEIHCMNHTCLQNQFKCNKSNKCIPQEFRCDQVQHCQDGEDEQGCGVNTCREDQWQCEDTLRCIQEAWKCDGEYDCDDQSDEPPDECQTRSCPQNEFACKGNGRCIPQRWNCDGEKDCVDGSDEDQNDCFNRSCPGDLFRCNNYRCIPQLWKCDGDNDCGDHSDEQGCGITPCEEGSFQCNDGQCITVDQKCDGQQDCTDGSDETEELCGAGPECATNEFQCLDKRCIWWRWQCDGDPDCTDESDERDCENVSCHPDEFACNNNKCKPLMWRCDGEDDCGDNSDEDPELCATLQCPVTKFRCSNHICINNRFVCDDVNNCGDNSDESFCAPTPAPSCQPTQFKCKNDRCIESYLLCNGVDNCNDGSDEQGCRGSCNNSSQIVCSHRCSSVNGSFYCTCHPGYELQPDGVACGDINECRQFGVCTQKCENSEGSYECSCIRGYTEERINKSVFCKAAGEQPFLFVAEEGTLHHLNSREENALHASDVSVDIGTRILSLDVHYRRSEAYVLSGYNTTGFRLSQLPLNNARRRRRRQTDDSTGMIELLELDHPSGVAVDWVGDKIYWTDSQLHTVEVAELDGSKRKIIISGLREQPQSIVVHPKQGLLFFSNWGKRPRISTALMNGVGLQTIVEDNLEQPLGLAMDYVTEKLYWADSKVRLIESSDLNGGNRVPVISFSQTEGSPFSIDIFEDWIYGVTKAPYRVFRVNKFGNQTTDRGALIHLTEPLTRTSVVKIVQEQKQDQSISDPCVDLSCGDDQLCLLIPASAGSRTCSCPDGYEITNTFSCVPIQTPEPCKTRACANNGTCIEVTGSGRAKCRCPVPFYGENCEQNRCTSRCQNNGTCHYDETHVLRCECTPRWKGSFCTEDRCRTYCNGHGKCSENADGLTCKCDADWTGPTCQSQGCHDYCQNGGVCSLDDNNTPQCMCPKEFHGDRCDESGESICDDVCVHGDSCQQIGTRIKCFCTSPRYTGDHCDEDRCSQCNETQTCQVETDKVSCKNDGGPHAASHKSNQPGVAVIVIPILVFLFVLVIIVLLILRRKHRPNNFSHTRITNEDDMEFGNPTFKYSRQLNEEEEEPMDGPFTIRDHKARTNFSNPIYGSLINKRGSELSLEEQNRFIDSFQNDRERLLDDDEE